MATRRAFRQFSNDDGDFGSIAVCYARTNRLLSRTAADGSQP